MSELHWIGGASRTAQVDDSLFAGTFANGETVTTTLTDEGGGTHQKITTLVSPGSVEDARDQVLADLQGMTGDDWTVISFSESSTNVILATADTSGIPFHMTMTTDSASGTVTLRTYDAGGAGGGSAVASSGPNDINTLANWNDDVGAPAGSLPGAGDDVRVDEGNYSMWYGLQQSAALNTFVRGPNYTGEIGNRAKGYYLTWDVNSGSDQDVVIDGSGGGATWFSGTCPTAYAIGCAAGTANEIKFGGDIDNAYVTSGKVRGSVTFKTGMTLDNVYVKGTAPGAVITVEANVLSFDLAEIGSGQARLMTNPATLRCDGQLTYVEPTGDEDFTTFENRGAALTYKGGGDATTTHHYSGRTNLQPYQPVTFTTVHVYDGELTDRDSPNPVSYTTVYEHGGTAAVSGTQVQRHAA